MERKPALSVCLIVRDEAARLPHALASLRGIPHEAVVVDTGSRDGTIAVARSLGARVLDTPWTDDFSAPRNVAIAAALGDWILCMDADENLMPGQSSVLRDCLIAPDADAWNVTLRSKLSGAQAGMEFQHRFPRLFRNGMGIRFTGRVHEQLRPSLLATGARVRESGLVLLHTGYDIDAPTRKAKLERNLHLLQLDHADRPDEGFLCFHLGETWTQLAQPAEGARWYERALASADLDTAHRAAAHQNLASVLLKQNCSRAAATAALRALRIDRDALPAWLHLAGARIRMGQYERGVRCAETYLRRTRRVSSKRRSLGFTADPARAWLIAGEGRLRLGRFDAAMAAVEHIRAERVDWAPCERLAGRIELARGRVSEAAAYLHRAAELEPHTAAGWRDWVRVLAEAGDLAPALAAAAEATAHVQDTGVYRLQARLQLQVRDWEGAVASYEHVLRLEPGAEDAHRRLAGLYRKLGDGGRACRHLEWLQRAATAEAAQPR